MGRPYKCSFFPQQQPLLVTAAAELLFLSGVYVKRGKTEFKTLNVGNVGEKTVYYFKRR